MLVLQFAVVCKCYFVSMVRFCEIAKALTMCELQRREIFFFFFQHRGDSRAEKKVQTRSSSMLPQKATLSRRVNGIRWERCRYASLLKSCKSREAQITVAWIPLQSWPKTNERPETTGDSCRRCWERIRISLRTRIECRVDTGGQEACSQQVQRSSYHESSDRRYE